MMANEKQYLIIYLPAQGKAAESVIVMAMSEEHARLKFLADYEGATVITIFVELKP